MSYNNAYKYVVKEQYSGDIVFQSDRLELCEQWCADYAAKYNCGLYRCWEITNIKFRDCGPRVFVIETVER